MIVLGISGWKRSGKDASAEYLIKEQGYTRIAFADPLKEMTGRNYNIDKAMMYEDGLKDKALISRPVISGDAFTLNMLSFIYKEFKTADGKRAEGYGVDPAGVFYCGKTGWPLFWTTRALLIMEGSTKRCWDSGFWVNQAVNDISHRNKTDGTNKFVITDLRYKTEMAQMKQMLGGDFTDIRVNRFDESDSNDPSERDLDDYPFSYKIDNRSTLDNLYGNLYDLNLILQMEDRNK